jgi:hypothetical protein
MNNIQELTRTSDSVYFAVLLPKDSEDICLGEIGCWELFFITASKYGYKYEDSICLHMDEKPELLGTLDTLTEDQAREIIPEFNKEGKFISSIGLVNACIQAKGVNTKENCIPIIKVKL